jgi:hypothetical protein
VFLRDRAGFDCILGNPPWETVKVETHKWWALRFPGLISMPTGKRDLEIKRLRRQRPDLDAEFEQDIADTDALRDALHQLPYPGLGTGDVDLYEVFAWRMLDLVRPGGYVGVVFPRQLFASGGTSKWRHRVLETGSLVDVTLLLNNRKWAFNIHPQWTIVLTTLCAGAQRLTFSTRGPFPSQQAFDAGVADSVDLPTSGPIEWSPTAMVPLVPNRRVGEVLQLIYGTGAGLLESRHPWAVRTYNELHASREKPLIQMNPTTTAGLWPVYKGESISLWEPDTGIYYGWANPRKVIDKFLMARRPRQARTSTSAFFGMPDDWVKDPATLPCNYPRVAWRMIARATDTRTLHAALIPPKVFVAHHCYLLFFPKPVAGDDAYILGVMGSLPYDWIARRLVEVNLTAEIVTAFPIPVAERSHPLRRRVAEIAATVSAIDDRYTDWANEVGVPVGTASIPDTRLELLAELDAAVALLYGLDATDLHTILETYHQGWDYRHRLKAVIDQHARLEQLA